MPALRKKNPAPRKTHVARKPAARKVAKGKRKSTRQKKLGWFARQKQRWANLRDRIASYRTRAYVAAAFAIILTVYGALAAGAGQWASTKIDKATRTALVAGGLSVQQIRVEGRNRADIEAVRKAIGINQGASILHFDVADARARIEEIDWVEDAKVIRFLPRTIHVVITERQPVAIWQMNGKLHLVDNTGFVLEEFRDDWAADLPLVVGDGAPAQANELLATLATFPLIQDNFASAIRVADRRWNIRLSSGVEIRLPAENISFALARIVEYNEEHDLLGQEIRSVDLRVPDRVYLTLTDDEAARLWSPRTRA